jgi:hypothetical protein
LLSISDKWTPILADAAGMPIVKENVVDVTPYDIPIAPSIIAKTNPAAKK